MRSRLRFWKFPLIIIMLLVVIAAFTLIYALTETAAAPDEYNEIQDSSEMDSTVTPESDNDPEYSIDYDTGLEESLNGAFDSVNLDEDNIEDEPEDEPADEIYTISEEYDFVTIHMNEEDIYRGFLVLVNHDHTFELPAPLDLVNIVEEKTAPFRVLGTNYLLRRAIVEPLDAMMAAYIEETGNNTVAIISAFRNYAAQQNILDYNIRRLGRTEALRGTALPGHSEHHTALAVDFGVYAGGTRSTFTGTGVTSWFNRNARYFGFILRFPENKFRITQTIHEPWHFRFVGLPHSIIIHENNWVLEEYLEMLREYTYENPFIVEVEGITYEIYFSADTNVRIPLDRDFDISGNNFDGFIITSKMQEIAEGFMSTADGSEHDPSADSNTIYEGDSDN